MIVHKKWVTKTPLLHQPKHTYGGWFLFGFIPLYINRIS